MPGRTAQLLRSSGGARRRQSSMATAAQGLCAAEQSERAELGFGAALNMKVECRGAAGVRLKEGAGGLSVRAVGYAGERHGEDRGLC